MKTRHSLLLALQLIGAVAGFGAPVCPPKVEWQRTYGGTGADSTRCIAQFPGPEGGYLVAGNSSSEPWTTPSGPTKTSPHFGGGDYWALRLDANGDRIWDFSYGGTGADVLFCSTLTDDGGFLLAGWSRSPQSVNSPSDGNKSAPMINTIDWWVVKCDGSGNKLWDKSYSPLGSLVPFSVVEIPGGDLLICGTRGVVMRTDSSGTVRWQTVYAGPDGSTTLAKAELATDGSFFLTGGSSSNPGGAFKQSLNYGGSDLWFLRIGAGDLVSGGNYIWDGSWGGLLHESTSGSSTSTRLTPDGGFIACGTSTSPASGKKESGLWGREDAVAVRYLANGTKDWDTSFGGIHDDEFWSVASAHNADGYVFSGYSFSGVTGNKESPNRGGNDGWVVRVRGDGTKLWEESYGGSSGDAFASLQATSDGGYILAGQSSSPVSGNKTNLPLGGTDIWIVKLGTEVDNDPPVLLSVSANCVRGLITLTFDEVLDPVTAETPANYRIDELGVLVVPIKATLNPDRQSVRLELNANQLSGGGTHRLMISGVKDFCGNVLNTSAPFEFTCLGVISGTVFRDTGDCGQGLPADFGLPNWQVTVTGGGNTYQTFTHQWCADPVKCPFPDGFYEIAVPPGEYTVTAPDPLNWTTPICATPNTALVVQGMQYPGRNFPKQTASTCADLWVTLTADYSGLKIGSRGTDSPCCGQDMKLTIKYGNLSTAGAAVPNLPTAPVADRAKLDLILPGYGVDFIQFSATVPASAEPVANAITPRARWTLPFLAPGAQGTIVVTLRVRDCDQANTPPELLPSVRAQARIFSKYAECIDATGPNLTPLFDERAACSGDPNGKQVSPQGCGPQGYVPLGQELTYLVEFQNTGTGPAYHVVLHDLLSTNLDLATVTVTKSSHPHVLTTNGRELLFTFWGIYLPAVSVDEPASHGFVEFRVRPRPGAPAGTVITNRADIYFDLNEPVLTGTTTNTLTDAPLPVAAFTATPRPGSANQTNDFTYTGGTVGATFRWDFGPDAVPVTSTDPNPAEVVFTTPGLKVVTLIVGLGDCESAPAARVFTVGRPELTIERNATHAFLSWEGDGWVVEETEALNPPVTWHPSVGTTSSIGDTHLLTLPLTPEGNRFFRLREAP